MSTKKPRETRAQHTQETSRRIREVALNHIAQHGIDGLSMAKVAEDAGYTKSPLYRRYDDAIDLAVDVWDHHLRDHLHEVLQHLILFAQNDDIKSLSWLAQEMSNPSQLSQALIECLAASRRYDYLLETVELDVDREFGELTHQLSHFPQDVALSHLSFFLGALFIGPLLPVTKRDFSDSFMLWHQYLLNTDNWLNQPMPAEVLPIPVPTLTDEDPALKSLITAAVKVIMRTGFERATANRIARYANKAFSTSYSYFDSKEELTSYAAEFIFRSSVTRNDVMFGPNDISKFTEFAAARVRELSTESQSEDTRLFRIEATLAARHHGQLRKSVQLLFEDSLSQLLSVVKRQKAAQNDARIIWCGVRVSGFGHNLLGLVARDYRAVNWMTSAHAAAKLITEHAMVHYVGDPSEVLAS